MHMYQSIISFFAISLLAGFRASALDLEQKFSVEPSTYYREIHQSGFSDIHSALDFFIQSSAEFRVTHGKFGLEVKPEVRGLYGRGAGARPVEPAHLTVRSPDRFMSLRQKLDMKDDWYLEIERLALSYRLENFELSAGRKPVSLGVLKVFSVWNKFSRPLPMIAGPTLVFSSDNLYARYQKGEWSLFAGVIEGQRDIDRVSLLEATYFGEALEAHFLLSRWWQRNVGGVAFAKDLWGATVRWENLWVAPGSVGDRQEYQTGLGAEYAVNERITVLAEFLFQSDGSHHRSEYLTRVRTRYQSLPAFLYNYSQLQYKLTSFWTVTGAALVNMVDWSFYAILKANYSYSDNVELYGEFDMPTGRSNTEFSRRTLSFPGDKYIGGPTQVMVGARVYF